MKVPFFRYSHIYTSSEQSYLNVLRDVGRRGAFVLQQDLAEFEQALAQFTGAKYAVGVANATDGLQMALMAGGLEAGDEVLFCAHTMMATASAIHYAGGIPVPVEVGPDHLIDFSKIEMAITPKTRSICPTQLNGRTANMDRVQAIADKHGLQIYEDAAQALGSKWNGKCAGTFGVASCISFYPAKVLGTLGDAGAVLTNNEDVYNQLMLLRNHGRDDKDDVLLWGFNSRLDNLHAAFLHMQLKDYPSVIERRRELAARYQDQLGGIEGIILPPSPDSDARHFDIYQNYEIESDRRDELKIFLEKNGVGTHIPWGGKLVHQFHRLGFDQSLPFSERLMSRMLMLPMNMSLSNEEIDYVCAQIFKFCRG
ncbi:DegT/DnrJ/EryC1/StrS family aminotransferase [bacterium]|nr:DegT/DnrJ/EryC1/StrS family aminotransferase [bacterium]